MPARDLPLRCACTSITGLALAVDPARAIRLVCMCDDCQAYAHWLERADSVLDAAGGTEVVQTWPARVEIHVGRDRIRCVRLGPKGLMRWYASCCKTPLFNTIARRSLPFIGVQRSFLPFDDEEAEQVLGPIRARVQGRFGKPPLPPGSSARAPVGVMFRALGFLARGWAAKAHTPSPTLDGEGRPFTTPYVLSAEERERLRPLCGPGGG